MYRALINKVIAALFLVWAIISPAYGDEFFYRHGAGDRYRILSTVDEYVYVNRSLSHRAEILNRIAVTVLEERQGVARHQGLFQTAERSEGIQGISQSFQWAREYESVFDRDQLGYMTIDSGYYMPVVRNVPVFPARNIEVGETWTAEGHEMHDFRDSFGIQSPYRIPFTASYAYLGSRTWRDQDYPAISVTYRIFYEPPRAQGDIWPMRIMGASDQIIYWDHSLGQARSYQETFRMVFELSNGMTIEYRGTAESEILESQIMNREAVAGEIQRDLDRLGVADTTVRIVEEGVTLSLENIQFPPDSAVLIRAEQEKLDKIAEILLRYPDRDIMVGGHTALAGTAGGRMQLSQERATVVANYLLGKGVRRPERIITRGYGSERPLGDNNTQEGMRINRRVEITILEN